MTEKKTNLHERNKHNMGYDFKKLVKTNPELSPFVILNKYENQSIDFSNPQAVLMLNKSLLKNHYEIEHWNIPEGYLCPPIPGRSDYIHYLADLLANNNNGVIPRGKKIKCLDIGVGANCIYPIIGNREYNWSFVGSDIDSIAVKSANKIIEDNNLGRNIKIKLQKSSKDIFKGIIDKEFFDLTICNPPFHTSLKEANAASTSKLNNLKNLNKKQVKKGEKANFSSSLSPILNFGGKSNELWCDGGEKRFIEKMIMESKEFSSSCFWFSTLVSKKTHLKNIQNSLDKAKVTEVKIIEMSQGNKISRVIAWTFLTKEQQKIWVDKRWN
jgi:23S rRNA (adenine1618-N6)-methyltransferase